MALVSWHLSWIFRTPPPVSNSSGSGENAILGRAERLQLSIDRATVAPRALFALADRHGISAYDAAYVELAQRRGLPLATRDANLARAVRGAGVAVA